MSAVTPLRPYPGVLVPPVMASCRLFRTDMARSFAEPLELAWPYSMEVVCNPDAKTVALSNVYEAVGVYTVTVRVTDDGGLVGTDTATITVNAAPVIGSFVVADVTGTDAAAPTITLGA